MLLKCINIFIATIIYFYLKTHQNLSPLKFQQSVCFDWKVLIPRCTWKHPHCPLCGWMLNVVDESILRKITPHQEPLPASQEPLPQGNSTAWFPTLRVSLEHHSCNLLPTHFAFSSWLSSGQSYLTTRTSASFDQLKCTRKEKLAQIYGSAPLVGLEEAGWVYYTASFLDWVY